MSTWKEIDVLANNVDPFWAGHNRDKETGLFYCKQRYYDQDNLAFNRPDPALDGYNIYSYVRGNPIEYTDPTGLKTKANPVAPILFAPEAKPTSAQLHHIIQRMMLFNKVDINKELAKYIMQQATGLSHHANTSTVQTSSIIMTGNPDKMTTVNEVQKGGKVESSGGGVEPPDDNDPNNKYSKRNGHTDNRLTQEQKNHFLSNATKSGKGGVSPVGRALQKHASREGSAFEGATGNAAKNTEIGTNYLKNILKNGTVTTDTHKVFGDVTKVRLNDGSGAWFKKDGTFIGLLERFTTK